MCTGSIIKMASMRPHNIALLLSISCISVRSRRVHAVLRHYSGAMCTASRVASTPLSYSTGQRYLATVPSEVSVERMDGDFTGVSVLTMNRPSAKNALGRTMLSEFNAALEELARDKGTRVVIVRSAVVGVFCAGADLKERAIMSPQEAEAFVTSLRGAFDALAALPSPTIACIDGVALGGGLEMALACDFRMAGRGAVLGLPETSLAIIPGAGGTQRLPRLIGMAAAKELIFTGTRLSPLEALSYGLVTRAVGGEGGEGGDTTAMALALHFARRILPNGPIAVRMAKRALAEGCDLPLPSALSIERTCYGCVLGSVDRVEGLAAFKAKRRPVYTGE